MKTIGITGGIGTGKSVATDYLEEKGYTVYDADKIAREVVEPGTAGLNELVSEYGETILDDKGNLDRKALGQLVFGNEKKLKRLNEILHGKIEERFNELISNTESEGAEVVFISAPLLIESGLYKTVDDLWLIDIEEDIQLLRVMERDNISKVDAKARIDSQLPRMEKWMYANVIIDNSEGIEQLHDKIDGLLEERL